MIGYLVKDMFGWKFRDEINLRDYYLHHSEPLTEEDEFRSVIVKLVPEDNDYVTILSKL